MAGTFGYELATDSLTEEEKEEIKKQVIQYKKYEDLIQNGYYYRLSNPFQDACAAWMFAAKDKKTVLLNVVLLENHGNMTITYVKLKGLAADARYEDAVTGERYYGSALMEGGLPMPAEKKEYPAYQRELRMVK